MLRFSDQIFAQEIVQKMWQMWKVIRISAPIFWSDFDQQNKLSQLLRFPEHFSRHFSEQKSELLWTQLYSITI